MAMDELKTLSISILSVPLKAAVLTTVHGLKRTYPELNLKAKQDIDADIEDLFGNSFFRMQMELEQRIEDGFEQNLKDFKQEFYASQLKQNYRDIKDSLSLARNKYNDFIRAKNKCTWKEFFNAAEVLDAKTNVLYDWITKETPLYKKQLMKELGEICDLTQYKLWQQDIWLMLTEAYRLRVAVHYYIVRAEKSYMLKTSAENVLNFSAIDEPLPEYIRNNMKDMEKRVQEISLVMESNFQDLRLKFLSESCGGKHDKEKNPCGTEKNAKCFELGSRVYKRLGELKHNNKELAKSIGEELRKTYPHFQWSVVVFNQDNRYLEYQFNQVHLDKIWIQRFGSKQELIEAHPENFIVSSGSGSYGCLLCYRVKSKILMPQEKRTALVFWAEPDVVRSPVAMQRYEELRNLLKTEKIFADLKGSSTIPGAGKGAGKVLRVIEGLTKAGKSYLFGFGIPSQTEDTPVGLDLDEYFHLDEKFSRSFPLCIKTPEAYILIAPDPFGCFTPKLKEGTIRIISESTPGSLPNIIVKERRLEQDLNQVEVVAKEISVQKFEGKEKEYKDTLAKLDANLSGLVQLCHPNIVKHIGTQQYLSNTVTISSSYAIVMEFCTGGSLSARMNSNIALQHINEWGTGILKGLAYLHRNNIAHKALYGDHVMFQRQSTGAEIVKIISVTRITDVLNVAIRSYKRQAASALKLPSVFEPPDSESVGSKTDIYHFGCLLIQMATSKLPELEDHVDEKNRKVKLPQIPKDLPGHLSEVIHQCLVYDYNKRPDATSLINTGWLDTEF